jgi:cytoskeletal protein CcmA (bactofilin family)
MSSTTFSGPVTSTNGFVGAVTGNVTGAVAATTVTASGTLGVTGDADSFLALLTSSLSLLVTPV